MQMQAEMDGMQHPDDQMQQDMGGMDPGMDDQMEEEQ